MNEFLPSSYVEVIQSLALGIEPIDAQFGSRLGYPIQVIHDAEQLGLRRPRIERHVSNLFSLRYQSGVADSIDLRFFDSADRIYNANGDRRRMTPRRLKIPVLTLTDVESQEAADRKGFARRIRRPVFFPGAACNYTALATGLRGRIARGGKPMRWGRVVARLAGQPVIAGYAHGDDRGEFLLLINSKVTTGSTLPQPLKLDVTVSGPATAPTPGLPGIDSLDPLWDLPVEELAPPGSATDTVADGTELPSNYTASITKTVDLVLGTCLCENQVFEII